MEDTKNVPVVYEGRRAPDSSIVFFSHSRAANGGFYGYGELLGKSGSISDAYRQKK